MKILVDSREQAPYSFADGKFYTDVTTERGNLNVGDYSLVGMENRVSVERKSLPDLINCLGSQRQRFEREILRARGLDAFAVVVEANWRDLASHDYPGKLNPHSGCQSILAWMSRFGISFIFAGSRQGGEYVTWSFLRQYARGLAHDLKAIEAHFAA